MDNYIEINKSLWDKRTAVHINSAFYDNSSFLNGRNSLTDIELELFGDVSNKSILHLQCHFGQDTLSLARMGAKTSGVDFSSEAIKVARELNETLNQNSTFYCCDVYKAPSHIEEKFDIVFTSYGTIGWLPDIEKWAEVVSHFMKPGGQFIFVEFHPVVWMFDNNFSFVQYPYFKNEAIIDEEEGSYAQKDAAIKTTEVGWNHGLGEVINALMKQGLTLSHFDEYDYSPHNCFNDMNEFEKGKFRLKQFDNKIPMVYSLVMCK